MRRVVAVVGLVVALWLCGAAQVRCFGFQKKKQPKNPLSGSSGTKDEAPVDAGEEKLSRFKRFRRYATKKAVGFGRGTVASLSTLNLWGESFFSMKKAFTLQNLKYHEKDPLGLVSVVFRSPSGKCVLNIENRRCELSPDGVCLRLDGKTGKNNPCVAEDVGAITAPKKSTVVPIGNHYGFIHRNFPIVIVKGKKVFFGNDKNAPPVAVHARNECNILVKLDINFEDWESLTVAVNGMEKVGVFLLWERLPLRDEGKLYCHFGVEHRIDCGTMNEDGSMRSVFGKNADTAWVTLKPMLTEEKWMHIAFVNPRSPEKVVVSWTSILKEELGVVVDREVVFKDEENTLTHKCGQKSSGVPL